jgi:putative membrane protein
MLIRLALRLLVLAAAIWLTTWLLPGFNVAGGVWTYLWVAFVWALVNAFLGPILHLIALPLTVVTFGLFALVVNAALVGITAWLSSDLSVDGFFPALFAAILISLFAAVLNLFVPGNR